MTTIKSTKGIPRGRKGGRHLKTVRLLVGSTFYVGGKRLVVQSVHGRPATWFLRCENTVTHESVVIRVA